MQVAASSFQCSLLCMGTLNKQLNPPTLFTTLDLTNWPLEQIGLMWAVRFMHDSRGTLTALCAPQPRADNRARERGDSGIGKGALECYKNLPSIVSFSWGIRYFLHSSLAFRAFVCIGVGSIGACFWVFGVSGFGFIFALGICLILATRF